MKSEYKTFIKKIKFYHILILGCFLCPILISNSNRVNRQRAEEKLNEEKSRLFNKIISGRYLQGEPEPEEKEKEKEKEKEEEKSNGTDGVCKRGSEELNNYYKTGNLEEIKLKEGGIKSEDKDKDYMKAIINILKSQLGGKGKEEGEGDEDNDDTSPDPGDGRRRNLNEDEAEKDDKEGEGSNISTDDIIAYGKHLLPVVIFFVVAILCIPGWLMCCFCCCCNCCCCCCCKRPCCRIPCFVITYALYALVVGVCIYGISQSNHIFVGIADTECSILRFFDEILEGEIKTETPRWAGFEGIIDILDGISGEIGDMKTNTRSELNSEMTIIDNQKKTFINYIQNIWTRFRIEGRTMAGTNLIYKDLYSNYYDLGDSTKNGEYVLDLIKYFGYYDSDQHKFLPDGSTLDLWEREYKVVSETADENMRQAQRGFDEILGSGDITQSLNEGKDMINDIKGSFNDIKGPIADMIVDNSETIDDYGKLGIKAVFGVLALINVAIAAFMLLLCFCSGKCCTKCCCCRCICKLFTHILWNILALLMIIVFLVGSLLALIGKVGSDAMSVISYVVSEDNIGPGGDAVLVDQLEDNKKYINICIGGDGKLEEALGLDLGQVNSINEINDAENEIRNAKREFNEKKDFLTYNHYIKLLEDRVNLVDEDLSLLPVADNIENILKFNLVFNSMNDQTSSSLNEKWEINNGIGCNSAISSNHDDIKTFDLKKCKPSVRYPNGNLVADDDVEKNAKIISDILDFVDNANNKEEETPSNTDYYKKTLDDLKEEYDTYLTSYINALDKFNSTIHRITGKLNEYTGGSDAFSFANCNFIGTNLKIILKYLKEVFGGDIYTIGVCLILVGCSLALSISFTILLIVVINKSIDENKNKN